MLVLGSLLALISGMFNAAAAALEKREGMRSATGQKGFRLLAVLARRPLWLLAMALSARAWVAEAAALALAPVPVVATVRNSGRGLLVVAGGRWLEEHFTRLEVGGVALASAGGALTTLSAASAGVWLMLGMAAWSQSLLQQAFRKTNAATVSAANASVASLGLVGAGFARYGQVVPRGAAALALAGGVAVSLIGTAMLLGGSSPRTNDEG
jgi:hypothetical protein